MLTCSQEEQCAAGIDMCLSSFPQCTGPWLVCSRHPAEEMSWLERAELWQPEPNQGSGLAICADVKCGQFKPGLCGYGGGTVCVCSHGSSPSEQVCSLGCPGTAVLPLVWKFWWFVRGEGSTLASKVCLRSLSYAGLLPHTTYPERITKRGIIFFALFILFRFCWTFVSCAIPCAARYLHCSLQPTQGKRKREREQLHWDFPLFSLKDLPRNMLNLATMA